ncbi:glycosyltransferase family 9 protein [Caldichromatium japonicum]|uniref:Glycosyltransferase family 9 protein n=1 Tax=Caldichromatium japonicum TaxID=2699430 RepID=A0A6G7VG31_9GAMM|nr:glycosyltransferase family 9 protein [Caldichromatium japonicum]QIK38747.1 glycosyltransferase family 9 protein [Caldichromatium japonicum]
MHAILIVRLSAIGDIVFASPLIAALRQRWPDAQLVWLVQSECAALLERHPELDAVIACPLRHWQRLWRAGRLRELYAGMMTLRANLRAYTFDLALDLQGLFKSGFLTWLSGARARIGLGSREGSQWLMTEVLPRGGEPLKIASEYRYLAEHLGLPLDGFQLAVHYGTAEATLAEATIIRSGLENGYAVLCPFTTRPQKHWIEERWGRLAQRIRAELGLTAVLLGGPGDRLAARRIADAAEDAVVDLVGQTSLTEVAALIDRAALLIGVDTGLAHMGIALNTPSLLLFGSTRPYLETGRPNAQVLYHPLPCSPCKRRPSCQGRFDCMRAIDCTEILQAAAEVLRV